MYHKAVDRVNELHAPYIKAGKISQDDLAYILWTGIIGPLQFIKEYEWRQLSQMEVAAHGVFWKYTGEKLGIDFATVLQKETWADGVHFLDHLREWATRYEAKYVACTEDARNLSETLVATYLRSYPNIIRPFVYQVFLVFIGSQLRPLLG